MIDRTAMDTLKRLVSQFPVVGITGPRQSGKSTLARAAFPNKKYVSFDDKTMRELAASNPKDFLLAFPDGVILDEAQKIPDIFDAVKIMVDSGVYEPGKYILTGSSQFRLRENMTDSLAGRAAFLKLLPFSVGELKQAGQMPALAYELAFEGQYPPLHDREKYFLREDWFENYLDTYLDLDVKDRINPSNLSVFRKFIQVCALYSGQLLSMEHISRDVGVSAPTIKSWLSILEASYIIHLLEPDTLSIGKALVKTPKLYFIDTGLLCYLLRLESKEDLILSPYKGAVIETFAVSELLKSRLNAGKKPNLSFYRDVQGFEVDTIANWKRSFAIEIKSDSDAEKKLSGNTRRYIETKGDADTQGAVFYLGDLSCEINGIHYVSWKDWTEFCRGV